MLVNKTLTITATIPIFTTSTDADANLSSIRATLAASFADVKDSVADVIKGVLPITLPVVKTLLLIKFNVGTFGGITGGT